MLNENRAVRQAIKTQKKQRTILLKHKCNSVVDRRTKANGNGRRKKRTEKENLLSS